MQKAPNFIRKLDRAAEVDQGEPLELKCIVEGSPIPKATWFKDGQEIEPNDRYARLLQKSLTLLLFLHILFIDNIFAELSLQTHQMVLSSLKSIKLSHLTVERINWLYRIQMVNVLHSALWL